MKEDKTLFIKTEKGYKVYTNSYNYGRQAIRMIHIGNIVYSDMREAYRYTSNFWIITKTDEFFHHKLADFLTKLNRGTQ